MSTQQKNTPATTVKTIYGLAISAIILTFLATILIIAEDYQAREKIAQEQLDNFVRAYHDNAHLIMSNIDSVLLAMENTLMFDPSDEELHNFLESQGAFVPMVRTLLVVNSDGIITGDSRSNKAAVGVDVSDRDYFTVFKDTVLYATTYVDNPVQSRVNGEWSMPISMGIYDNENNLTWVVVASVEPRFFSNLNFSSEQNNNIRGFIINDKNRILSTIPYDTDTIGKTSNVLDGLEIILDTGRDHHSISHISDKKYFTSHIDIEPYGVTVVFQHERTAVYASFTRNTILVLITALVIIGGIGLIVRQQLRLTREMNIQISARQQSEADYQRIAETAFEGIWEFDAEDKTSFVNSQLTEMFGYTAEEMIGRPTTDFLFEEDIEGFYQRLKFRKQGKAHTFEARYRHKTGKAVWARATGTPIFDTNQQYIGSFGMLTDITHSKSIAQKLEANQQKLQAIFDSVGDALLLTDDIGNYVDVNPAACEMFGYTREEFLQMRVQNLTASDTETYLNRWQEFIKLGAKRDTYKLYRKSGVPLIVEGDAVINLLPGKHLFILRDVTERKKMERELKESEDRFRKIADNTPTFIWVIEADKSLSYVNKAWLEFTGQSYEEAIGMGWFDTVHPDYLDIISRPFSKERKQQSRLDITARFQRHDGVYRWIRMQGIARYETNGQLAGYIGSSTDITEQLEFTEELAFQIREATLELEATNEKLRESESLYRTLADMSSAYSYAYRILPDGTRKTEWITDSFAKITGYTLEDIDGDNIEYFFADSNENVTRLRKRLAEKPTEEEIEFSMPCKWGEIKHFVVRLRSVWDEDEGRVVQVIGTTQDITRRKQAEDALLSEHNFLQNIINTNPGGILVMDAERKVTFANLQAQKLLGLEYDIASGSYKNKPGWQTTTLDGEIIPDEERPFSQVRNTKTPIYGVETAMKTPEGKKILLSVNGMPQLDENGDFELAIFNIEDITLRLRWQQQLEESFAQEKELHNLKHRFVTLISHELRTPMSIIMTSSEILQRSHQKMSSEQIIERTQRIQKQVMRLKRMMEDISFINKADMKGHELQLTVLDVPAYCKHILDEISFIEEKNLTIETHYEGEATQIVTDETLFYQIMINLVTNAMKYSQEDGRVEIACHLQQDKSIFTVKDAGIGIPQEDQPQLFQSFHRASNVSNIDGTGLGLNIVKRAVTALGGEITFESQENVGTTFTVTLPTLNQATAD